MMAPSPTPRPTLPATAAAANTTTPSTPARMGVASRWASPRMSVVIGEDLLDSRAEVAGQGDSERERRHVARPFDGVDGLAGHAHRDGQIGLRDSTRHP